MSSRWRCLRRRRGCWRRCLKGWMRRSLRSLKKLMPSGRSKRIGGFIPTCLINSKGSILMLCFTTSNSSFKGNSGKEFWKTLLLSSITSCKGHKRKVLNLMCMGQIMERGWWVLITDKARNGNNNHEFLRFLSFGLLVQVRPRTQRFWRQRNHCRNRWEQRRIWENSSSRRKWIKYWTISAARVTNNLP